MRNLTKVMALLLAVAMIFTLSACGEAETKTSEPVNAGSDVQDVSSDSSDVTSDTQSDASSEDKPSSQQSSNTSTVQSANTNKSWKEVLSSMPKSIAKGTLKVASWNEIEQVKEAPTVVAKFEKMTGIDVQWQVINYGEYTTQIAAMIAANKAPDIVRLHAADPADMSVLQPISVSGFTFDKAWNEEASKHYTVNGKVYAVNVKDSLFHGYTAMYYNRDLIGQYDLEDPYELWKKGKWNFDKFIEICEDFRDEAGSGFTPWSTEGLYDYATFLGTSFVKFDGKKYVNNLSDKKLLTAWQQTLKWIDEGVTVQGFWDQDGFNSGKVLFHSNGIIGARATQAWFTKHKSSGTLGVVPVPEIKGQKYVNVIYEMEAYGIAKGAKNPKAVPYFLRYYLDADNYNADKYFCDKRALEVYNWLNEQGNNYMDMHQFVITKDAGYEKDMVTALKESKSAQVATILKSYNAVINRACQQTNDKLSKLK